MSPNFLNSIDFAKGSMTVSFSPEEEILNDDESVLAFCERLEEIVERHSFVNQLSGIVILLKKLSELSRPVMRKSRKALTI